MPNIATFSDIATHWASACILVLAQNRLVSGYPDGTFRPDGTITRAEFAALIYRLFPEAAVVRSPLSFGDVPASHWARSAVEWVYQRGFFSGYPDQTFRPELPIPRVQAIAVLATAQRYNFPAASDDLLRQYFDDAAEIPDYAKGAIAAATLNNLVINYPLVRQLAPNRNATRGEITALLCQARPNPTAGLLQAPAWTVLSSPVPPQYVVWSLQLKDIQSRTTLPLAVLQAATGLIKELQTRLNGLKLYPGGRWIDGIYSPRLAQALTTFSVTAGLPARSSGGLDGDLAQTLLTLDPVAFILRQASDRTQLYSEFLQQEAGFNADKLAFLDRGIQTSPYRDGIKQYPDRLKEKPDGVELVSLGESLTLAGGQTVTFRPYPSLKERPVIEETLGFLHGDVQQACLCVGSVVEGKVKARWLGRNALDNVELWSTTKIIPLFNIISRVNTQVPGADIDNGVIRASGSTNGYSFYDLALDVVSYQQAIATSNSAAAMFKQFDTPVNLENWLKGITGNLSLQFRGRYGELPFIQTPELWDRKLNAVLLQAPVTSHLGSNTLSVYDLTRLMSMLGWHHHLPLETRLPGAQWDSLECLVRVLGTDSARYVDVAIDRLGLATVIRAPVILSKLGYGRSQLRDRSELAYTAFVQWVDKRPKANNSPAILRTLSMTLLLASDLNDANQEATRLDARMASEVTEILRRIMTQELA